MPGTGHSARYKGSISNRSKVSPFEHLAKWNQQLLGADGAIPTIVGGNSLEFKKLDASDIAGVMHNPAVVPLDMSCKDITQVNQLKFCVNGYIRIPRGTLATSFQDNELIICNNSTDGNIQIKNNQLKLRSLFTSPTVGTVDFKLDAAGTLNNENIHLVASGAGSNSGKINIGFATDFTARTTIRQINIGHTAQPDGGRMVINIGTNRSDSDTINIGHAQASTIPSNTNILARGTLKLGNTNTSTVSLTSVETIVTGTDRLTLISIPGSSGVYIGQTGDKIGFFGVTPQVRPSPSANATAIHAALVSLGLFQ